MFVCLIYLLNVFKNVNDQNEMKITKPAAAAATATTILGAKPTERSVGVVRASERVFVRMNVTFVFLRRTLDKSYDIFVRLLYSRVHSTLAERTA